MAVQPEHPREEYFENERMHVEVENDEDLEIIRPWNPDDIRVDSKTFSIRNVLDMVDEHSLDLAPDFQRQQVWKPVQKSRLIESILLRIPLPSFYFTEERDGIMRVVDGLQRLSTIHAFVRGGSGEFALKNLEYLKDDLEGKRFSELATSWQRRLNTTQLFVHVIDPSTPDSVKFDIFRRINTGGSPLNGQEIRHCMSGDRSRKFLKDAAALPAFQDATGGVLRDHPRMVDREVVLRYFAFRMLGQRLADYGEHGTMDAFLTAATRRIDDADDSFLQALMTDFQRAMVNAHGLFGEHAFRKWTVTSSWRSPINRPLFESWAVVLTDYDLVALREHRDEICLRARELMTYNTDYINAISIATGDPRRVQVRFSEARDVVQQAVT